MKLYLYLATSIFLSNALFASGPKFKGPLQLDVECGVETKIHLRGLLTDPLFPGHLEWELTNGHPSWVKLDTKYDRLLVTPNCNGDVGTHRFKISVFSDEAGDIDNRICLDVKPPAL